MNRNVLKRLPLPDNAAALISVHDRTGVVELARKLIESGTAVYATSGSATARHSANRANKVSVNSRGL